MQPLPIILASGSPQRRHLMEKAGYKFVVRASPVPEPPTGAFADPAAYAAHAAWVKARAVAATTEYGIVLAADTVVALQGKIIGKPADRAHAEAILQTLSGSVHECLTGVCLWSRPDDWWLGGVDRSVLRMRTLNEPDLQSYLNSELWLDKAGAYGIQDPDPYVEILAGSHSNVVGLPMELVGRLLEVMAKY